MNFIGVSIQPLATTTITHLSTSPSLGLLSDRQRERMVILAPMAVAWLTSKLNKKPKA